MSGPEPEGASQNVKQLIADWDLYKKAVIVRQSSPRRRSLSVYLIQTSVCFLNVTVLAQISVPLLRTAVLYVWLKSWNETRLVTMIVSHVSLTGFEASLSTLASVSQRWWPSERLKKEKITDQKTFPIQQKWRNETIFVRFLYPLHQWCINQRAERCADVIPSELQHMSSSPEQQQTHRQKTDATLKKLQSFQRDERRLRLMRESSASRMCGIPTCSSSWLARYRTATGNWQLASNLLRFVFSQDSLCYSHMMTVKWNFSSSSCCHNKDVFPSGRKTRHRTSCGKHKLSLICHRAQWGVKLYL